MLKIFHKSDPDDSELLRRFQQHQKLDALGQLYDRYMDLVYGICLKIFNDQGKAEDAVMGIFEELVRKLPHHQVSNFKSWLHTFTRNFCLMQLRKEKKDLTQSFDPGLMYLLENSHQEGEETDKKRLHSLKNCLEKLSPEQKECIQSFYYEGKSYNEIAALRDEDTGKIRSYIQNGRRNLKKCIEQRNATANRK